MIIKPSGWSQEVLNLYQLDKHVSHLGHRLLRESKVKTVRVAEHVTLTVNINI